MHGRGFERKKATGFAAALHLIKSLFVGRIVELKYVAP